MCHTKGAWPSKGAWPLTNLQHLGLGLVGHVCVLQFCVNLFHLISLVVIYLIKGYIRLN